MNNITENLILLVQPNPCLYMTKDRDYKNSLKKEMLWEKISKKLGLSREEAKSKWKNLKDGYTKFKKESKGSTGQAKKYHSWVWGPYLQFLDSAIEPRPTQSNISDIENENHDIFSPTRLLDNYEDDTMGETVNLIQSESSSKFQSESPLQRTVAPKRKKEEKKEDDVDKVIDYLKNKKEQDTVDLLFESYAKAFKTLKRRTQTELKLRLAQIFAEAELKDLEENRSTNRSPLNFLARRQHSEQDAFTFEFVETPEDLSRNFNDDEIN